MTSSRQIETAAAYEEAGVTAAKATMYDLAVLAREEHPDAKVVQFSESDQGSWLSVDFVETGDSDEEEELVNDDGLASCLYSDIFTLRELYSKYDVRGEIEYSRRMGIGSFRMDVTKVLAECAPPADAVHTVKATDKTLDTIEWCLHFAAQENGIDENEKEAQAVLDIVKGWRK
jgi:hypothetical protein